MDTTAFNSTGQTTPSELRSKRRSDRVSKSRKRVTFYLDNTAQDQLEELWFSLRQLATRKDRGRINKSRIIEAALEVAWTSVNCEGQDSAIVENLFDDRVPNTD